MEEKKRKQERERQKLQLTRFQKKWLPVLQDRTLASELVDVVCMASQTATSDNQLCTALIGFFMEKTPDTMLVVPISFC